MKNRAYKTHLQSLAVHLRDPFRFRIFVTLCVVAVAYVAVFTPLSQHIDRVKEQLQQERRRETLAQDVDLLRAQMEFFEDRLAPDTDVNEWVQYVLGGVRQFPLTLINLDSEDERRVGTYHAVAMRLAVAGEMQQLDALLNWLETNERLFRIDDLILEPSREHEHRRTMTLILLGLRG